LAFRADGRALISGGADRTCLVWDATGRDLAGAATVRLTEADLEAAWTALGGKDAARAFRATAALAADPDRAVPFLAARVRPVPRAPAGADALAADLDSPAFADRERAEKGLVELGAAAEPALRRVVAGPSAEARQRAQRVLDRLTQSADRLVARRVVEVLELAGTAEARRVLAALAAGADGAWLTEEARPAAARSGTRP
jgi:hypothetical protein